MPALCEGSVGEPATAWTRDDSLNIGLRILVPEPSAPAQQGACILVLLTLATLWRKHHRY